MIVTQKMGNLSSYNLGGRSVDRVALEWHEVNKRILHKKTQSGKEVTLKFLQERQELTDDDILFMDDNFAIVVDLLPCETICIKPIDMQQMATICYEIGNKHLPLFYQNDELLIPFDAPIFKLLSASGYALKRESRKLLNPLKTTVAPHSSDTGKQSLFSKILQLTTTPTDANY